MGEGRYRFSNYRKVKQIKKEGWREGRKEGGREETRKERRKEGGRKETQVQVPEAKSW